MKIPNLIGKDYETILKAVRGIVHSVKNSDNQARGRGELVKYVIELYDDKDVLNEVKEFYSKHYVLPTELASDLKLNSAKHLVRGPFPLNEGALADAKINRWQSEKEKEKNDSEIIKTHLATAEGKEYKYGYIVYEEILGIKRFVELTFSDKAMSKQQIDKILNSSPKGRKRQILRIKLANNQEKLYQ